MSQRPTCHCLPSMVCACERCASCADVLLDVEKTGYCGECAREREADKTRPKCGRCQAPCLYSTDLARDFMVCDECAKGVAVEREWYQRGMLEEREAVAHYLEAWTKTGASWAGPLAREIREGKHRPGSVVA